MLGKIIFTLILSSFSMKNLYAEKQKVFKLGIIAPFSGGLAEYGVALQNGMKIAQAKKNKNLIKLEIYFEDHVYNNHKALASFYKLKNQNKVDMIFLWGSGPSEAVAPIAERMKFPLIILGDHTANINKKYVINFTNPARQYSKELLKALRKEGHKNFSIILNDINYLRTLTNSFKAELRKDETLEIIDSVTSSISDFKTMIAKLKRKNTDAVGVFLVSGQISKFYRQMSEQNLSIPSFGTDFFESRTEIKAASNAINGAIYAHNIVTKNFSENYVSKYKNDIQLPTAARGYDLIMLISKQVNLFKGDSSGIQIFNKLERVISENGSSGEYSFINKLKTGKYFHFPIVVKRIQDEVITEIH